MSVPSLEDIGRAAFADRGSSICPFLIGAWISAVLEGLLVVHFAKWIKFAAEGDPRSIRVLMYSVFVMASLYTLFLFVWTTRLFAFGFGSYAHILDANWFSQLFLFEMFIRSTITIFLIHRVHLLSKSSILLVINIMLLLGYIACNLWTYIVPHLPNQLNPQTSSFAWAAFEVTGNVLLTVAMMYCLLRSKTGWRETDKMVSKLARVAVETQVPPTIFAIVYIGITVGNTDYGPFFMSRSLVYAVSIMALINSRYRLRQQLEGRDVLTLQNSYGLRRMDQTLAVNVTTETFRHTDATPVPPPPLTKIEEDESAASVRFIPQLASPRKRGGSTVGDV